MTADPIPVTLLTGFLGSGKTTLLNRILKTRPLTGVVMNEFGEVGLDHQLVEGLQGPMALLSGGCLCCQVQGSPAPILGSLLHDRWLAERHVLDGVLTSHVRRFTREDAHSPQTSNYIQESRP